MKSLILPAVLIVALLVAGTMDYNDYVAQKSYECRQSGGVVVENDREIKCSWSVDNGQISTFR